MWIPSFLINPAHKRPKSETNRQFARFYLLGISVYFTAKGPAKVRFRDLDAKRRFDAQNAHRDIWSAVASSCAVTDYRD